MKFPELAIVEADTNKPPVFDEHVRRVERGSKIVTIIPNSTSLILQMPRGNLETIYPRALVLTTVRHHLNKSEYKLGFMLCRKHRIDMNLLYDHDASRFNVEVWIEFIKQIEVVDYLNLFVTSLKDENVCISMYSKENKVGLALK